MSGLGKKGNLFIEKGVNKVKKANRFLSWLCCMTMVISMLPWMPARAASVMIDENFESMSVGDAYSGGDSFKNSDQLYDGFISRTIEDRDGDKYLKITAQNEPSSGKQTRARMSSKDKINGTFTVEWDVNNFDGTQLSTYIRGTKIRIVVKEGGAIQLYVHSDSTVPDVMKSVTADFTVKAGSWYTFKVEVNEEKLTLSVYDKAYNNMLVGTQTIAQSNETLATLFDPNQIWFDLSAAAAGNETAKSVGLDNIYVAEGTYEGIRSKAHSATPVEKVDFTVPKSTKASALKVLVIGDDGAMDAAAYLPELARLTGNEVSLGCLYLEDGTIRQHAENSAKRYARYTYYKGCDATSYRMTQVGGGQKVTLTWALTEEKWDAIVLQQGMVVDGLFSTHITEDPQYMLDLFTDRAPQAKLYWHMNWTADDSFGTDSDSMAFNVRSGYDTYYNNDAAYYYNAIIDCLNEFILTEKRYDGVIYSGYAVENVRGTALGKDVTRDGLYLARDGRLTAGMTMLKTLIPGADLGKVTAAGLEAVLSGDRTATGGYRNTEENLALIKQAVGKALSGNPEKRTPAKLQPVNKDETLGAVEISQAPYMLRFPNIAIMDDGTMYVSAKECVSHKLTISDDPTEHIKEGNYRQVFWKSTDNGKTWQRLSFVLDQEELEAWGICQFSDRYERLKNNPNLNYVVSSHSQDCDLASVHVDINGDGKKENILVLTFWHRNYYEGGSATTDDRATYITYSTDGLNWVQPTRIEGGLKRGSITEFKDGSILVPLYSKCLAVRLEFKNGKWNELYRAEVPFTSQEETTEMSEIAFVSPAGDDTVYCMVRASGAVLRSDDAGRTWTEIANEPGTIHQPSFTRLDDGRVFVVWAKAMSPRLVYGKMYYPGADWSDTETQLIIDSERMGQDMGSPVCVTLPDGTVYVVGYDLHYRSLPTRVVDTNNDMDYLPIELRDNDKALIVVEEQPKKQLSEGGVSAGELSGSYTVWADFTLEDANSSVAIQTAAGRVTVTASALDIAGSKSALSLTCGTLTHARVARVGSCLYVKVWQGNQAPENYTYGLGADGTASPAVTGSNAVLENWKVTKNVTVSYPSAVTMQLGGPDLTPGISIVPAHSGVTLTSSDPNVVSIMDGNFHAVSAGKATVTMEFCGKKYECVVTVKKGSLELDSDALTTTVFADDFEQYSVGRDAFWKQMGSNGYASNTSSKKSEVSLNIEEADGNQYLALGAANKASTWHKVSQTLTGDYTVQFDYKLPGGILYLAFWQDSNVHERVLLRPDKIQFSYRPIPLDQGDSESITKDVKCDTNDSSGWYTFKGTRANGCIMLKVWKKGTAEPSEWTAVLTHSVLDSSQTSTFRFQYYNSGNTEIAMSVDNFTITQNVEKNNSAQKLADLGLMGGVGINADGTTNFDLFRAPNRAEAIVMLLRLLGKESEVSKGGWEHPFTDVPSWANNWVGYAYQHKLTSGTGQKTFGSNDVATGAMYVTFVLRAMGYSDVAGEFSWDKPHELAAKCGLIDKDDPLTDFLRGDLADVSVKAMANKMKDGTLMYEKLSGDGAFTLEKYRTVMGVK